MISLPAMPTKEERLVLFGSVPPVHGSKPIDKASMTDLQNQTRDYLFDIDAVGISNIKHPIAVLSNMEPSLQTTTGHFRLTTSLRRNSKGINMSRLTEQLDIYYRKGLTTEIPDLCEFTSDLAKIMNQEHSQLEVSFPWFFERSSPSLKKTGLMYADTAISVTYDVSGECKVKVELTAAITTLCPCSKEISEYSAHNQRGYITMTAEIADPLRLSDDWKVKLLNAAESNASSLLYPVLKRPDEKAVTECAYENPRFVEDMVRLVAADLIEIPYIQSFTVACKNEESIHQHDAVARLSYIK
ncbi:GTP cyclohydrolase FolE2 [Paenibacillus alkaliterrae]|uniref:GTP cyclohydrolase FolE2 n=1 Tax=Paenibacillus alkaliterrae TaxID=320909 RepID=UPI001F3CF9A0|nr:GTP cyclohydrolase FolE2 [Paenibacillus alkaliterrae]MCF2940334.1 GTP cyclohydrolase FolE2 [Paenibacillus alkaliterrae]